MYGFPTRFVFKSRFSALRATCLKHGLTPAACGAALLAPASPGRTALRKRSEESPLLEREVQRFIKASTTVKARSPSVFRGGARRFSRYTMQSASRFLHEARARRQLDSIRRRESEILLPSLLWFDFIAARCCSCRSVARVFVSIVSRLLSFLAWHDRKDHADVCVVVCGLSRGQSFKVRKARSKI